MKKLLLVTAVFVFAGIVSWKMFSSHQDQKADLRNPAAAPGYCIALRGNGEAEPAHWGALARSVEQLGLPIAMSGGSSASISMFLMEAIASHPAVKSQKKNDQKERASLMLKSLVGFFGEVQKTDSWNEFKKFYGVAMAMKDTDVLQKALAQAEAHQLQKALGVLQQGVDLGVLDPQSLKAVVGSIQQKDVKRTQFYLSELLDTAKVFGKFRATGEGSENLFFRSGIVNFEQAAKAFGKIAAFYALASGNSAQKANWDEFFKTCQAGSIGKSWMQIAQGNPTCAGLFAKLFTTEFAQGGTEGFEERRIGEAFPVYPSTAILTGTAVTEFRKAHLDYHRSLSRSFGNKFEITHSDDIRFGYWGDPASLSRIEENLDNNDEKSRRFVALGSTVWRQVLALSPAEPGLSPLKEFTTEEGKEFVSAGGWADLHPVLLLKAAGCDNVLYITRRGGESLFAQGVAKRLFGFDREWAKLNPDDASVVNLNNEGDRQDQTSLWSALYNLGNPHSSYNQALAAAGAVMCTNWNDFPPQSQFMELVEDSYRASYWKNPKAGAIFSRLAPTLNEKRPGCYF